MEIALPRALFEAVVQDSEGDVQAGVAVTLRTFGTATPIAQTLYDAPTGGNVVSNPLTTDANGYAKAYADNGERVTVAYGSATGVSALWPDPADMAVAPSGIMKAYRVFDQGGAVHNVKSVAYGALGDQSTNDTAAIAAAIAAAAAEALLDNRAANVHGATIYFPPGTYRISHVDLDEMNNVVLVGTQVRFLADLQAAPAKPILSMVGSNNCHVEGITLQGTDGGGTAPPVVPTCGILCAPTVGGLGGDSNKNSFVRTPVVGFFAAAGIYLFGSTDNQFQFCGNQQYQADAPVLFMGRNNAYGVAGASATIYAGTGADIGETSFFQCEFHDLSAAKGATTGSPALVFHGANATRFYGGNCATSKDSLSYVRFRTYDSDGVVFNGVRFYPDTNGSDQPFNLVYADDAITVTGLKIRDCTFNNAFKLTGSNAFIRGEAETVLSDCSIDLGSINATNYGSMEAIWLNDAASAATVKILRCEIRCNGLGVRPGGSIGTGTTLLAAGTLTWMAGATNSAVVHKSDGTTIFGGGKDNASPLLTLNSSTVLNPATQIDLQINGASKLKLTSTGFGLNGATPAAPPNFTITNPTADRLTLDQTSATAAEVREVLGTVVKYLIANGIFS